jgi:hypothetical protein
MERISTEQTCASVFRDVEHEAAEEAAAPSTPDL